MAVVVDKAADQVSDTGVLDVFEHLIKINPGIVYKKIEQGMCICYRLIFDVYIPAVMHTHAFSIMIHILKDETLKFPSGDLELKKYGWLSLMAACSRGQIGALCDESFYEHILSCANDACSESSTNLGSEEINMLVVLSLRMNLEFMEFLTAINAQLHIMTLVQ